MSFLESLPGQFKRKVKKYKVPGASLAILRGCRVVVTATAGVTSLDTRIPVTDQTLFQIGSITKTMTTTLAMQLVDEGKLDLDEPVISYLPGFRVADANVSRTVTPRQFLSHQSGIDGDFFVEAGRGDEASQRLLDMASMMPNLYAPGEMLSYCNLGFVVVGRIIEQLTGMPWDDVMRERIFEPLGMEHAFTRPEDGIRFSCAIGHVPSRSKKDVWYPSKVPYLSQGQKAAGATPTMTPTDLLKFVQMHLNGGKNAKGEKVLSAKSVNAMQKRQIRSSTRSGLAGWGIGWMLFDFDGERVIGHDGGTIGQAAFLRIHPKKKFAVAMLTNGGDAGGLYTDVYNSIFEHMAKVSVPGFIKPDRSLKPKLEPYTGVFENLNGQFEISIAGNGKNEHLEIEWKPNGGGFSGVPAGTKLVFADKDVALLDTANELDNRTTYFFSRFENGKAGYMATGSRQYRRVR